MRIHGLLIIALGASNAFVQPICRSQRVSLFSTPPEKEPEEVKEEAKEEIDISEVTKEAQEALDAAKASLGEPKVSITPPSPSPVVSQDESIASAVGATALGGIIGVSIASQLPPIEPNILPLITATASGAAAFVGASRDDKTGRLVRNALGRPTQAFGDFAIKQIQQAAINAVESVKAAPGKVADAAKRKATETVENTKAEIKAIPSKVSNAAQQAVEDTVEEIKATPGRIADSAQQAATEAVEELKATPGRIADSAQQAASNSVRETQESIERTLADVQAFPSKKLQELEELIEGKRTPQPPKTPPPVQESKGFKTPTLPKVPKLEIPKIEKKTEPPRPPAEKPPARKLPKLEIPKLEVPKVEVPKVELPKVEIPKVELPTVPKPSPKQAVTPDKSKEEARQKRIAAAEKRKKAAEEKARQQQEAAAKREAEQAARAEAAERQRQEREALAAQKKEAAAKRQAELQKQQAAAKQAADAKKQQQAAEAAEKKQQQAARQAEAARKKKEALEAALQAKAAKEAAAQKKQEEAARKRQEAADRKAAQQAAAEAKKAAATPRPSFSLGSPSVRVNNGKAPRGVPTIVNWRKRRDNGISGKIYGSPSFDDGDRVETSEIVFGEISNGSVVKTSSGSRYFLSDKVPTDAQTDAKKKLQEAKAGATINLTRFAMSRDKSKVDAPTEPAAQPRPTFSLFGLGAPDGSRPEPPQKKAQSTSAPRGVPSLRRWKKNGDGSVTGFISGSPNFRPGEKVTTSPIKRGKIEAEQIVTTGSGSRYFLEK